MDSMTLLRNLIDLIVVAFRAAVANKTLSVAVALGLAVVAYGISAFLRYAPIRCPVKNALLCTEASSTASAAILVGIQGDTSFAAAAFSRRTFVATATAIKPVEDNVCAYTAAAEVFRRRTAAVPALFLARWARASPAFRGSSPGHPRDGSQNSTDNGATH